MKKLVGCRALLASFFLVSHLSHAVGVGSCETSVALPIEKSCRGMGSTLTWSGQDNAAFNCSEPIVSAVDSIFASDRGGQVLVILPSNTAVSQSSLDVQCALGASQEVSIPAAVLSSLFPDSKQSRNAVLCTVPAYTDLPVSLQNVNLSVPLNVTVDGSKFLRSKDSQIVFYAVSQLEPSFGLSRGGSTVTVHGSNLQQAAISPACRFQFTTTVAYNASAPWSEASLFQGDARTFITSASSAADGGFICNQPPLPPHIVGTLAVSVSPDQATLPWSLEQSFDLSDPAISSVSVARSPTTGGVLITVAGQGFATGQGSVPGTPTCRFDTLVVPGTVNSDSSIECTAPARDTGSVPIELSLNGQVYFSGEAEFEYFPETALTSMSPSIFPNGGGTIVTVFGSNFQTDTSQHGASCRFAVTIGAVAVSTIVVGTVTSSTTLICTTPLTGLNVLVPIASGNVEVSFNVENNADPQYSPPIDLEVFLAPVVDSLDPNIVCEFGGTTLTITGSNFDSAASPAICVFAYTSSGSSGSDLVSGVKVSSTEVTCTVPAAAADVSQFDVCVSLNGGADCSNSEPLAVYASTSISPTSGPSSGGTAIDVTLNAAHSPNIPAVCTGVSCAECLITTNLGGITQTTYGTANSLVDSTLVCTMPPQTPVETALLFSLNQEKDVCGDINFEFYAAPTADSVFPSTGPVTGGTQITITGSEFYLDTTTASPMCSFGVSTAAASLSGCVGSVCTVAECTTPSVSSAGTVDLALSFNGQQYQTVSSFQFYEIPVVAAITPSTCPNTGGTPITISGQHVTSGTNSTRLCQFWPASATRIEKERIGSQTAMTVSASMVGSSVVCQCPTNTQLKYQELIVWLAPNGQQFEVNTVTLLMHQPIIVRGFTPLSANVLALNDIFAVGENFIAGDGLVVIIGTQVVQAEVVREGVVKVSSRGDAIGTAQLSVSNNGGVDFVTASQTITWFSGGLNCPENCGVLGTCSSGSCVCDDGYCGAACSFLPTIGQNFPTYGSADGGETLAIRGVGLGGDCSGTALDASWLFVRVNGGTEYAATFDAAASEVQVLTRSRPEGTTWSLEVSFDNKVTWISAGDALFSFGANPQVIAAVPTSGVSGGDTLVTVFGSGFHDSKDLRCRFGSAGSTEALFVTANRLLCGTPPSTVTGVTVLDVSNNNQDYSTTFEAFRYYNISAPYEVLPTFGALSGGTTVTVRGSEELVPSAVCTCQFDDQIIQATVRENSIFCIAPSAVTPGVVPFAVLLDGQHAGCAPASQNGFCEYLYFSNLGLSNVYPSAATRQSNITITVTGEGFLSNPSAACQFGTSGSADVHSTSITVQSVTVATCEVPHVTLNGVVDFSITINGADYASYASGFTFYALPSISRVAPNGSPIAGGAMITIEGTGFGQYPEVTILCRFSSSSGYEPAAPAEEIFGTTGVACLSPATTRTGTFSVQVALLGEQDGNGDWIALGDEWSDPAAFFFYREGVVDHVKPWEGYTNGGALVTLLGSGLSGGGEFTRCRFGETAASGTVLGWWGVVCKSPVQTQGFVPMTVSLNGQSYSTSIDRTFTAYPAPAVLSVVPSVSPVSGGASVQVHGSGFQTSHLASCYLKNTTAGGGAALVPATVVGTTAVLCSTPAMPSPGAYTLQISINDDGEGDGEPVGSGLPFVYHADPIVVSITPSNGVLEGGTVVTVDGQNLAAETAGESNMCQFGQQTSPASANADGSLECSAPPSPLPDASSVPIYVSRDGGNFFTATNVHFSYFPTPSVSLVTPSVGVISGGTVVTASGQGFRSTDLLSCRFGNTTVLGTLSGSGCNTTVACVSPALKAGTYEFGVSLNSQMPEFSLQNTPYIFHVPVEVTFAGPSAGPFFGGTLVTFSGTTVIESRESVCKFGTEIGVATFKPPHSMTCVAPARNVSTLLPVEVSLNNQEFADSTISFSYTVLPQVTGSLPLLGPEESGSTITISGVDFVGTTHSACKVGNNTSPATVLSSTKAVCTAVPIRRKRISTQLQDWFNDTDPVDPVLETNSRSGVVDVAFGVDGQFFSEVTGNYTYYLSPSVFRVFPASAPIADAEVVVVVNGSDFLLNLTGAAAGYTRTPRCKFGSAIGAATVFANSMILCTAKSTGVGEAVAVAVALNGVDFEMHNSAFFLWLAPAPVVQAVEISSSMSQVLVRFADTTDRGSFRTTNGTTGCGDATVLCPVLYEAPLLSGPFQCETILAAPTLIGISFGTGTFGGTGPSCYWVDNTTLTLQLGYSPSLAVGDPIDVTPFAVMRGSELSYTIEPGTLPVLSAPASLSSPRVSFSAPNTIGPCDPLVLDGALSDNGGGQQLFFTWTLLSPTGTAQADQIAALLSASTGPEQDATFLRCRVGTCSSASIDASLLSAGDYRFKLEVESWTGGTASEELGVSVRTNDVPMVRIRGSRHVNASRGEALVLEAVASAPGCGATAGNVEFEWTLQIPGSSSNILPSSVYRFGPALVIPAYFLDQNVFYIATIEAFMSLSPAIFSSASVTVAAVASQPVSRILGGDRTVLSTQVLTLDGSKSHDPDLSPSENAATPVAFTWGCTAELVATGATSACSSLNSNFQLTADQATRTASVALRSGALPLAADAGYVFIFSLTVIKAGVGSASSSVRISVTAGPALPVVLTLATLQPFRTDDQLEATAQAAVNTSFSWSAPLSGVELLERSNLLAAQSSRLLVAPNVFSPGVRYTLRVDASLDGVAGSAEIALQASGAPTSGAFFISPTTGFAMAQRFRLVATGWTTGEEDLPLVYTFSAKGVEGWWAPITHGSTAPFVEAYLSQGEAPAFQLQLSLHVRDQVGSEARTSLCANEATDVGIGAELAECAVTVEPYQAGTPVASGISLMEFYSATDLAVLPASIRWLADLLEAPVVEAQNALASISLMNSIVSVMNANTVSARRRFGSLDVDEWASAAQAGRPSRSLLQITEDERAKLVALREVVIDAMERLTANPDANSIDIVVALVQSLLLTSTGTDQLSADLISRSLSLAGSLGASLAAAAPALLSSPLLSDIASSLARSLSLLHAASSVEFAAGRASAAQCEAHLQSLLAAHRYLSFAAAAHHAPGQDPATFTSPLFSTHARAVGGAATSPAVTSFGARETVALEGVSVTVPPLPLANNAVVGLLLVDVSGVIVAGEPFMVRAVSVSASPTAAIRFFDPSANEPHISQLVDIHVAWAGAGGGQAVAADWSSEALEMALPLSSVPDSSNVSAVTGRRRVVGCAWWSFAAGEWSVDGGELGGVSGSVATCKARSAGVSGTWTALDSDGGCDSVPRSPVEYDRCLVCDGTNECVDCADVPFGPLVPDECGVCGGSNAAANCTGCDGLVYKSPLTPPVFDSCGVCGGNGNDRGCDGECFSAKGVDVCGECGGDGLQCQAPPLFLSPTVITAAASPRFNGRPWKLVLLVLAAAAVLRL